jgi:sugar/nucleoside kinase (ribokinase family)
MKAPLDVVAVGNIVVDYPVGPLAGLPAWGTLAEVPGRMEPRVGGNGAIFAVGASRLGLSCGLVGKVGRDIPGDWILDRLKDEGVDTSPVRRGARGTSATVALVRQDGERAFLHYPGSNASLKAADLRRIPRCRWFHLSAMFLLPSLKTKTIGRALETARRAGTVTSLDVAWDPSGQWDMGDCLSEVDYFMPNIDEAAAITGKNDAARSARELAGMGARNVIIKLGPRGSMVLGEGLEPFIAPGFKVEATDSTGAGDTFDAAFIYATLHGMEPRRAAYLANAAGAMRAMGDAPAERDLLEFIRSRKKESR